tara:strand:+ start:1723 stop:2241 length:519 start_codon:yes stop_codon:yes gene_type:complete
MSKMLNPNATTSAEDFLDNAPGEVAVEEASEEEKEEAKPIDPIEALLLDFEDMPTRDTIEGWKERYGNVHAFVPSATEAFLFRPLRRLEYTVIARDLAQLKVSASAQQDPTLVENMTHEKVCRAVLLHPIDVMQPENLNNAPAGLLATLFELIMKNSHFVSPEQAMQACYRL